MIRLILLAAWLGAATLFVTVVAPSAFAVLPERSLAGALVGRVLPVLFLTGAVLGALGFVREWVSHPRSIRRLVLSLLLTGASMAAQFGVAPRIETLRRALGPSLEAVSPGDARRIAFGRLHGISVALLGVGMLSAAASLAVHARAITSGHSRNA